MCVLLPLRLLETLYSLTPCHIIDNCWVFLYDKSKTGAAGKTAFKLVQNETKQTAVKYKKKIVL